MINSSVDRKRMLIVEDEPTICGLVRRVFTDEGFEVDVAPDGRIAQSMIREREYDLYLIDIKLPVMDGKELYKWLQDEYPRSAGRAIFTTGSAMGQDTESFLHRSGRQVLPKPFTLEELKAKIRQALKVVDE
jgi:DNA-binding response OmpR family regulator